MKKCDICGRETDRIYHTYGHTLCSKHMHQYHKYGKFLDNIPRTNNDLNDYEIKGDIVVFNLYGQNNLKNGEFIIDFEDIEKVKYHKWRISHSHVVTGQPAKGEQRDLAHIILDISKDQIKKEHIVVDHINGNGFDNRKENLRICTQSSNTINKSFMSNNTSGFIGVSYASNKDRWDPEIRHQGKRCHLGYVQKKEEAVYKRYYAEQLVFKEFANKEEQKRKEDFTKEISEERKKELREIVEQKLQKAGLWQSVM